MISEVHRLETLYQDLMNRVSVLETKIADRFTEVGRQTSAPEEIFGVSDDGDIVSLSDSVFSEDYWDSGFSQDSLGPKDGFSQDRAYWYLLQEGKERCDYPAGSVVGVYADGIGDPGLDAAYLGVVPISPDNLPLGATPPTPRHALVAMIGHVPVLLCRRDRGYFLASRNRRIAVKWFEGDEYPQLCREEDGEWLRAHPPNKGRLIGYTVPELKEEICFQGVQGAVAVQISYHDQLSVLEAKVKDHDRRIDDHEMRLGNLEGNSFDDYFHQYSGEGGARDATRGDFHCLQFTRRWLWDRIVLWLREKVEGEGALRSRLLWISAEPGMGKTAFACRLCDLLSEGEESSLVASFFCVSQGETSSAVSLVKSLAGQCARNLPGKSVREIFLTGFRKLGNQLEIIPAIELLLLEPLRVYTTHIQKRTGGMPPCRVMVIDALDELSQGREQILSMLRELDRKLPEWLRVIVLSRPEADIRRHLDALNSEYKLSREDEQHLDDVKLYIQSWLPGLASEGDVASAVAIVLEKCQGIFIYLSLLRRDLEEQYEEFGCISLESLSCLPNELTDYYRRLCERARGGERASQESFDRDCRPLLALLVSSYESLSVSDAQSIMNHFHIPQNRFLQAKKRIVSLFNLEKQARSGKEVQCFKVFHLSFKDWLTDGSAKHNFSIHAKADQEMLLSYCRDQAALLCVGEGSPPEEGSYFYRRALSHLCHGEETDQARAVQLSFRLDFLMACLNDSGMGAAGLVDALTALSSALPPLPSLVEGSRSLRHLVRLIVASSPGLAMTGESFPAQILLRVDASAAEQVPLLGGLRFQADVWKGPRGGTWLKPVYATCPLSFGPEQLCIPHSEVPISHFFPLILPPYY